MNVCLLLIVREHGQYLLIERIVVIKLGIVDVVGTELMVMNVEQSQGQPTLNNFITLNTIVKTISKSFSLLSGSMGFRRFVASVLGYLLLGALISETHWIIPMMVVQQCHIHSLTTPFLQTRRGFHRHLTNSAHWMPGPRWWACHHLHLWHRLLYPWIKLNSCVSGKSQE